jgi:hypothetical protein
MKKIFNSNKYWLYTLRLTAFICVIAGLITLIEPFLEKKTFKLKCTGKERVYSSRLDDYSYKLTFDSGDQFVDPDVYDLVSVNETIIFKCTPFHYQIIEFIFNDGSSISNVRNYYAQIGFGIFFLVSGGLLLIFKFRKHEHLQIWTFLISLVAIFVLVDTSNLIEGNPFGNSLLIETNSLQSGNDNDLYQVDNKKNKDELDTALMMRIIEQKIKTPMDFSMTLKCHSYLKTSYSLMIKLLKYKEAQTEAKQISELDLSTIIMTNYLVCQNAIILLEKSTVSMNNQMQKELIEYKKNLELISGRVMDVYLEKVN